MASGFTSATRSSVTTVLEPDVDGQSHDLGGSHVPVPADIGLEVRIVGVLEAPPAGHLLHQGHLMAPLTGGDGGLHAGGTAAHNQQFFRSRVGMGWKYSISRPM